MREAPTQPTFSGKLYVTLRVRLCVYMNFFNTLFLSCSDAGVTSIQFSHLKEHIFAVGR